jgi:uncharacterized protein YegP (UPF0339 family)
MRFRVYQDAAGGWRWRLVAGNGRIVADSAEAYTRKGDATRALETVVADVLVMVPEEMLTTVLAERRKADADERRG